MGGINLANIDVGSVLSGAGTLITDIKTAITGKLSPEEQAVIDDKLADMNQQLLLAQIQVNNTEAGSKSWFVAGGRPAAIWVCDLGLLYTFIICPLLTWGGVHFGFAAPPAIDGNGLMSLITALLGLGGFRTWEKTQGIASSQNKDN